jgi:hypothetical protein
MKEAALTSRWRLGWPSRRLGAALAGGLLLVLANAALAGPRATLVEPAHVEKGEVEPGKVLHLEWTLRNDGDAPLLIESLEPTCYCTNGKADATSVPPGGSTKIRVTVDPSDFTGAIEKGVEITTNDAQTPTQLVQATMTVRPSIAVVPPELDFGAVPAAGSKELTVDLKAPKERPLRVKTATAAVPYLTVEQEPLQTDDRAGVRLFVKVKPGAPAGPFATSIIVETDDAAKPRIEVPVRGKGAGGASFEPERLVFEAAAPGAAVGTVTVRGGKGLQVTGVKCTSPALEATPQPQADGSIAVRVSVAKGAKPGRITARLLIGTSDASQSELAVPVLGVVK